MILFWDGISYFSRPNGDMISNTKQWMTTLQNNSNSPLFVHPFSLESDNPNLLISFYFFSEGGQKNNIFLHVNKSFAYLIFSNEIFIPLRLFLEDQSKTKYILNDNSSNTANEILTTHFKLHSVTFTSVLQLQQSWNDIISRDLIISLYHYVSFPSVPQSEVFEQLINHEIPQISSETFLSKTEKYDLINSIDLRTVIYEKLITNKSV